MSTPREVVVLGSTGSIGVQALEVVRRHPDRLRVVGLAAGGADVATLAAQAVEFGVETVAVARAEVADELRSALHAASTAADAPRRPRILVGPDAATELAASPCDVVLNGITGSIGLRPTLAALRVGHTLALANKESLIAGGDLVTKAAAPGQLVPVDSEHSALAQALRGGRPDEVRRLVLTASGGPFRGRSRAELGAVTLDEALAHPTWAMGRDITINSATLVNKGLELIEAHLLFDVPLERIEVVVHPQSIVHSMVEFVDGSTLAQASPPTMLIPIALALAWPDRLPDVAPACDWSTAATWEFRPLDHDAFPAVELARTAAQRGGLAPAVYNAANEECIHAFAAGRLSFLGIVDAVARVLGEYGGGNATSVDDVLAAEEWARARAREVAGLTGRTPSAANAAVREDRMKGR